ncbi:uncharacterized protein LOC135682084 isoform X2 [Rhopilema esculentum]|uniref:uncharacterized protein LOC135682084 isoform X2 n=1 Tax=Rhopilema esculentum TaxID=499914 RepID=UPI0031DA9EB0|eukprot:gene14881-6014_t
MLTIKTLDELFHREIPSHTTVSALSVPMECWEKEIHNLVPMLMSDVIDALLVDDSQVQALAEMATEEVGRILEDKIGSHFVCHGRKIKVNEVFKCDFVKNKICPAKKQEKELMRTMRALNDILRKVIRLYERFPEVEDVLQNAIQTIGRHKIERGSAQAPLAEYQIRERKRKLESGIRHVIHNPDESVKRRRNKIMRRCLDQLSKQMVTFENEDKASSSEEETTFKSMKCYICKKYFALHQHGENKQHFCTTCWRFNTEMRHQRSDLKGRYAIVTGGRIKIGFQTALKLLRDGCYVVVTTRFPNNAAARYSDETDYDDWHHRLKIYPLDLLNNASILQFIDYINAALPFLDILINNASQTISRPGRFYQHLFLGENVQRKTLPKRQRNILVSGIKLQYQYNQEKPGLGCSNQQMQTILEKTVAKDLESDRRDTVKPTLSEKDASMYPTVELISTQQLDGPSDSKDSCFLQAMHCKSELPIEHGDVTNCDAIFETCNDHESKQQCLTVPKFHQKTDINTEFPAGVLDSDGQQVDLRKMNSWVYTATDVPFKELLEVLTINTLGPFLLVTKLKDTMKKSPNQAKFIVNVSAMEGQFGRKYKTMFHPHTNMAKAALNMLTRTSGLEYAVDNIFMTAVDTGWVTDENPVSSLHSKQNETPLDCVDGAARVYHPIVHGLKQNSKPYFAVFIKDYKPYPW